jgi:hypothetical protein
VPTPARLFIISYHSSALWHVSYCSECPKESASN